MGNAVSARLENAEKSGVLQLSGLKLKKLPEEVKSLERIRTLDLSHNRLEVIKSWLGNFKNLKLLNVDDNKLVYFPPELCTLTKLESLSANRNLLTSIVAPGTVANLTALRNLRSIQLSGNRLTEFPVELCSNEIPINMLDLSHNQISIVPSCVSKIQAIEINLNHNCITEIASSIARCPRLKVLRLDGNRITLDKFPGEILTDSQISLLCVSDNQFELRLFYSLPGYAQYMERFTAVKKKAMSN